VDNAANMPALQTFSNCTVVADVHVHLQDPTGEAAAEAQKHLSLYELDLGLNHVSRKWSQPVDNGANMLIPVPGGGDGPGGVLVCAENFIIYNNQVSPLYHSSRLIFAGHKLIAPASHCP